MAKLFLFFVSLIAFYLSTALLILGETPATCGNSCGVVDRIQACRNDDVACTCAPDILSDASACVKCSIDAGVPAEGIAGFGLMTGLESLCNDFNITGDQLISPALNETSPPRNTSPNSKGPTNSASPIETRSAVSVIAFTGVALIAGMLVV
ncbi:hypothetical protein DFP72DRAFT_373735 [Ephemerocybe angulata]|uniref:Extracellular membrane protein CFEM domain-containing protein n=1 Tax=Ephemerocybe angulata TaxID=980116 RepID=A0A8H6M731_9AGAR|nr:hypothetical protein DFP72DRAFT_373735 [Tulosesus angulatus]